jgi:hypothetical protein
LIFLPLVKCSRCIRAIVSTTSIPNHLLRSKAGSATDLTGGGQFWTPIPGFCGAAVLGGFSHREGQVTKIVTADRQHVERA